MPFQPLQEPELLRVYRIDSGKSNTLDNRNGGTLAGILDYLDFCEDRLLGTGDYISSFEVLVQEGYDDYMEFAGGKPRNDSASHGKHVGKLVKAEGYVWYSFLQGGAWSLQRKIGSLALQEVYEFLRKPPRHQMNLSDQASQLETLFQEKFTY